TAKAYAAAHRARRVRDELSRSDSVTDAIYGAGFNSSGRFYATAIEVLGMTPTDFRSGGNGASIRFAVGECSLGSILVAATDRGVCAIFLGDDPDALVRALQDRFPKGALIGADRTCRREPLPPARAQRRQAVRLSLGRAPQARAARPRGGSRRPRRRPEVVGQPGRRSRLASDREAGRQPFESAVHGEPHTGW